MTNKEIQEKFSALLVDEKFVEKLASVDTAEAVAQIFNAEGMEMTANDAQQIMDYVAQEEEGELGEASLENVSGGIVWEGVYVSCFIIGVSAGLAHGAYKKVKQIWKK